MDLETKKIVRECVSRRLKAQKIIEQLPAPYASIVQRKYIDSEDYLTSPMIFIFFDKCTNYFSFSYEYRYDQTKEYVQQLERELQNDNEWKINFDFNDDNAEWVLTFDLDVL